MNCTQEISLDFQDKYCMFIKMFFLRTNFTFIFIFKYVQKSQTRYQFRVQDKNSYGLFN